MAAPKRLFMETTKIDPQRTVAQINDALVSAGARQIGMEYDDGGQVTGLRFTLNLGPKIALFSLPARQEPVFKIINGRRKYSYDRQNKEDDDRKQARRIAWRQLLRWVEAQLALIETGMVSASEVFLPYAQDHAGKTLYERVLESPDQFLALPEPKRDKHPDSDAVKG